MGWERIDDETWLLIRERLPRPLTREEAMQDLRYWSYSPRRARPQLEVFARNWGWFAKSGIPSVKRVRLLLSSGAWEDEIKKDRQGTGKGQRRDSGGTGKGPPGNGQTLPFGTTGTGKGQAKDSGGTGKGQTKGPTRVLTQNTGTQTQDTGHSSLSIVFETYADHHQARAERAGRRSRRRKSKPKGMPARVKEHGKDASVLVLDWAFTSQDERAKLLRDGDHLTDTLFGGKFENYLDMAERWDQRGRTTTARATPGKPMTDWERLEAMKNDNDQPRR